MYSAGHTGWRRPALRGLVAVLVAAPLAVAPIHAQEKGKEAKKGTEKAYQDWTLVCQKPDGAEKEVCVLVQQLARKEKDSDAQKLLMQVEVIIPPKGDQSLMAVTLPLGVPLAQGLTLQIDEKDPLRVPFQVCLPNGCQAVVPLKDDVIASLKGGKEGKVTLNERGQNPATLPLSLKGFTAGYRALGEVRK